MFPGDANVVVNYEEKRMYTRKDFGVLEAIPLMYTYVHDILVSTVYA